MNVQRQTLARERLNMFEDFMENVNANYRSGDHES
jgi:hypothetical protein